MATLGSALEDATASVRAALGEVEVGAVHALDATQVLYLAFELERLAHSVTLLFARRAVESNWWFEAGFSSPAAWLAEETKTSTGAAQDTLDTAERLERLPVTTEAVKRGELAGNLAREVTIGALASPTAEENLLYVGKTERFHKTKHYVRQLVAESESLEDVAARTKALHDRRSVHTWVGRDGSFNLKGLFTPDVGARLLASLQAETAEHFWLARQEGRRENPAAYQADALVALVTGYARSGLQANLDLLDSNGKTPERSRTDTIVIRVDGRALRKGELGPGEICEIPGVGNVSVQRVNELLPEAFVKTVIHDAVDVQAVVHQGRTIPATVLTALYERDGHQCVVPGCGIRRGLHGHHYKQPFAESQTTSLAELALVCHRHHDMIHYEGFLLGGGPGKWTFTGGQPLADWDPPDPGQPSSVSAIADPGVATGGWDLPDDDDDDDWAVVLSPSSDDEEVVVDLTPCDASPPDGSPFFEDTG
ncbi:MAG TPA: DUF222 domain-containing protein [Acidimicrobiales bacterium]|nr:DUF222 domain-containing protein [Acidimicrobiales bacterium]